MKINTALCRALTRTALLLAGALPATAEEVTRLHASNQTGRPVTLRTSWTNSQAVEMLRTRAGLQQAGTLVVPPVEGATRLKVDLLLGRAKKRVWSLDFNELSPAGLPFEQQVGDLVIKATRLSAGGLDLSVHPKPAMAAPATSAEALDAELSDNAGEEGADAPAAPPAASAPEGLAVVRLPEPVTTSTMILRSQWHELKVANHAPVRVQVEIYQARKQGQLAGQEKNLRSVQGLGPEEVHSATLILPKGGTQPSTASYWNSLHRDYPRLRILLRNARSGHLIHDSGERALKDFLKEGVADYASSTPRQKLDCSVQRQVATGAKVVTILFTVEAQPKSAAADSRHHSAAADSRHHSAAADSKQHSAAADSKQQPPAPLPQETADLAVKEAPASPMAAPAPSPSNLDAKHQSGATPMGTILAKAIAPVPEDEPEDAPSVEAAPAAHSGAAAAAAQGVPALAVERKLTRSVNQSAQAIEVLFAFAQTAAALEGVTGVDDREDLKPSIQWQYQSLSGVREPGEASEVEGTLTAQARYWKVLIQPKGGGKQVYTSPAMPLGDSKVKARLGFPGQDGATHWVTVLHTQTDLPVQSLSLTVADAKAN